MRISKKAIAASIAVVAAAGGGVFVATSADAATPAAPLATTTTTTTTGIAPGANTVGSAQVKDGSLYQSDFNQDVIDKVFRVPGYQSVSGWSVKPGSLTEESLSAAVKGRLDNGQLGASADFAAKTIEKIGGPFDTGKTEVGTLKLPAVGTYLVNTSAVFDRLDADAEGYATPTTDTYPSLVLRYDGDKDAGTIMGSPISKAGFVELTGSSTKTVTVDGPTVITVYGFGYNEDRSQFGAGQITVSAQVTAVKIH